MNTTDIIPAPRPQVPVHKHPSGEYGSACKVGGCGWTMTDSTRAYVEEQASYHRHQHIAAHGRQVVHAAIVGGAAS